MYYKINKNNKIIIIKTIPIIHLCKNVFEYNKF